MEEHAANAAKNHEKKKRVKGKKKREETEKDWRRRAGSACQATQAPPADFRQGQGTRRARVTARVS